MQKSLVHRLLVALVALAAILALVIIWAQPGHAADDGKVSTYKSGLKLPYYGDGTVKTHQRIIGGNAVVPDVVEAHVTQEWSYSCTRAGVCEFTNIPDYNSWDRASWSWVADTDNPHKIVKGSGCAAGTDCKVHYKYRRWYFRFTRLYQGILGEVDMWLSLTFRDNGTCVMDKFKQPGTTTCHEAAAGGGGGGSW